MARTDEARSARKLRRRAKIVTGEKWWPVRSGVGPAFEDADFLPSTSLTQFHPTVRRAMRDARGVVLEFHHRLGRPSKDLGQVTDLELRCILLDLAARWMRNEDDGTRE